MQKVTEFSKTKFCISRDIVIISVLHFMSKQRKIKLVSFLYLLGDGDCQVQKPPPSLCSLDMVMCAQRGQYSTHHKNVHSELAVETLTQLGKVDQTV